MSSKKAPPTLPAIGKELRQVVGALEDIQHHVAVCCKALLEQNADDDFSAAEVLRLSVSFPIYRQRRRLAMLAAKCDSGPVDEEFTDDDQDDRGEES